MKSKNPLQREDKKKPVKETEANDKTKVKADPAFTKQTRKNTEKSTSKDNSDNDHSKLIAKATGQRNSRIDSVLGDLKNISNGGLRMSDMPGNGAGGGPGAANYSQAVLGAYDDAWNPPPEITDDVAVAVAKVRVHRSGRITEARIIKRSNNALMDRSVQNALEAVKSLPPFPEGATDLERVFNIEFNLKAKRATG